MVLRFEASGVEGFVMCFSRFWVGSKAYRGQDVGFAFCLCPPPPVEHPMNRNKV